MPIIEIHVMRKDAPPESNESDAPSMRSTTFTEGIGRRGVKRLLNRLVTEKRHHSSKAPNTSEWYRTFFVDRPAEVGIPDNRVHPFEVAYWEAVQRQMDSTRNTNS